jgi:hypothetical protein
MPRKKKKEYYSDPYICTIIKTQQSKITSFDFWCNLSFAKIENRPWPIEDESPMVREEYNKFTLVRIKVLRELKEDLEKRWHAIFYAMNIHELMSWPIFLLILDYCFSLPWNDLKLASIHVII